MKLRLLVLSILLLFLTACSPSTDELYTKADELMEQKQYAKALEIYGKILKRNSKLQDALYNKGFCYFQDSNYQKALHLFKHTLFVKGVRETDNYIFQDNSDMIFSSELRAHEVPIGQIYYQIAITHYNMDSMTASYENFQRAINYDYQTPYCFTWQGIIWTRVGEIQKACTFFEKSKSLGDADADGLIKKFCMKNVSK